MGSRVNAALMAACLVAVVVTSAAAPAASAFVARPGAGGAAELAATTTSSAEFPRVVYARVPTPCDADTQASFLVYSPTAWMFHERLTWRVRIGDGVVQSGTVVAASWETRVEVTIPLASVPAATTTMVIDARGTFGAWGKSWVQDIGRDCHPLQVFAVGDSVMWGLGIENQDKWVTHVAHELGARTGRVPEVHLLARTSVTLDSNPTSTPDEARCAATYADPATGDRLGDGHIVHGDSLGAHQPDVFCQIWRAGRLAAETGIMPDVVLMVGCANDVGMLTAVVLSGSPEGVDLDTANQRECHGGPALPGAGDYGLGGRGLHDALLGAHELPGAPKVVLSGYYRPVTPVSVGFLAAACALVGNLAPLPNFCENFSDRAVMRSDRWYLGHTDIARHEVDAANADSPDGSFATFVDPGFLLRDGTSIPTTPEAKFQSFAEGPLQPLRVAECLHTGGGAQCLIAQTGHPNERGATTYADSIVQDSTVRHWFGMDAGDPTASVTWEASSVSTPAGVTFDAAVTPGAAPIVSYHWYFADGLDATTTTSTVTHTYTSFGTFWPVLTVTDAAGRTATATPALPVAVGSGLRLEVAAPRPQVSSDDIVTLRAAVAPGSDLERLRVEYRWDVDGDGSVDRVTRAPEYSTSYASFGAGTYTPSVSVAHITVSYASPSPALATAMAPPFTVSPGCITTDADGDGVPCPYDPDGDTLAVARPLSSLQFPSGADLGSGKVLRRLDFRRSALLSGLGAVRIEQADPADASRPTVSFMSLTVSSSVESGDGRYYMSGMGLCLASDPQQWVEYRFGACTWRMAVTRTDTGGSLRFDADLSQVPIHVDGTFSN